VPFGPAPTPKPKPAPAAETILARTPSYEVITQARGTWTHVTLRGMYEEAIVDILRNKVFNRRSSFAIDLTNLSGIAIQLARELYFTANRMKSGEHRLVLINPGEKISSLIQLIAPDAKIASFPAIEELPSDPRSLEQQIERLEVEFEELRKNLFTNPLWQFVDRETCWLCPFCANAVEDVKIVSRVSIARQTLDNLYRHLHRRCIGFNPKMPRFKPQAELETKIKKINAEKFSASKSLATALESKVRVLEDKAQLADSLEQSLKIAVDRQQRLLPAKPPQIPNCDIALTYRPAQRVSGDFYDFIDMGQGRMGFAIGDVAGHGIEAGILMGMTKKVLNIRASELMDPVEAMKVTNSDVYKDLDRQTFVTAFLAMLDPAAKTMTYARAGHNPPLLFNKGRTPPHLKLEAGGLMLGMAPGALFDRAMTGETLQLQAGDVILLYTDGLEEAKNEKQELFGLARVAPVLEHDAERPAAYILGAIAFELERFCGMVPQEDDITAICIKIS
jgi:serine phosphatase RsbU (regulator of sigma subunit)